MTRRRLDVDESRPFRRSRKWPEGWRDSPFMQQTISATAPKRGTCCF
jgi:hypothetical protein